VEGGGGGGWRGGGSKEGSEGRKWMKGRRKVKEAEAEAKEKGGREGREGGRAEITPPFSHFSSHPPTHGVGAPVPDVVCVFVSVSLIRLPPFSLLLLAFLS
jgi:hypothetical protein